jgi:hypothetical protein
VTAGAQVPHKVEHRWLRTRSMHPLCGQRSAQGLARVSAHGQQPLDGEDDEEEAD